MEIKIVSLKLLCKLDEEFIVFGDRISFFHGRMSSGKSTIVEMINYCFGGKLVKTPAVSSEVVKAQLVVKFPGKEVLFERAIHSSTVDVSWQTEDEIFRDALPLSAGKSPIIGEDIYNLSDFILTSMGIEPIKVRQRKSDDNSDLHRLSFRDFYKFCYLDQPHLDSSLFRLEQTITGEKSKDVLKYILGFQSDQLTGLQRDLQEKRQDQRALREAASQIREFLDKYGFASETEIDSQVDILNNRTEKLEEEKEQQHAAESKVRFVSDDLRSEAKRLGEAFEAKSAAIFDIRDRIAEQEQLRSELITLKLKAARASSASTLLAGAGFNSCPNCGSDVKQTGDHSVCYLCKSEINDGDNFELPSAVIEQDLTDRIDDLKISLRRLGRSLENQLRTLNELVERRSTVQQSIDAALRSVESEYLQRARKLEAELGKLNERRRFLVKVRAMPSEIETRLSRADALNSDISKILRSIEEEEAKFKTGRINLRHLEENFIGLLHAIHFPEISKDDRAQINTKTWMPSVYPKDNPDSAWGFSDVGSGGKTVLFKICYALALHKTVSEQGLKIPQIFIVDSTMKNITPDINPDVFDNFYRELYRLLNNELKHWQCIIVDQTFSPFQDMDEGTFERKMVVDDPNFPPLIGYYKGH